jgi:hypothetical protein
LTPIPHTLRTDGSDWLAMCRQPCCIPSEVEGSTPAACYGLIP